MSRLSSPLKIHPGLNVRQAKTTNIWLPNIQKVSFVEETYLDG